MRNAERDSAPGPATALHEEARMRNLPGRGTSAATALALAAGLVALSGCVPPEQTAGAAGSGAITAPPPAPLKQKELEETLNAAYGAFAARQYDQAIAGADRVLASNPQGPGAA